MGPDPNWIRETICPNSRKSTGIPVPGLHILALGAGTYGRYRYSALYQYYRYVLNYYMNYGSWQVFKPMSDPDPSLQNP